MGKIIFLILLFSLIGVLYAVPLWAMTNIFMFVFHLPYHLTLLQAVVICALVNVLHKLLFDDKEGK